MSNWLGVEHLPVILFDDISTIMQSMLLSVGCPYRKIAVCLFFFHAGKVCFQKEKSPRKKKGVEICFSCFMTTCENIFGSCCNSSPVDAVNLDWTWVLP